MLLLAGCGGSGVRQYPVQGKVFFHGQPAAGAIVVLHPVEKKDGVSAYPPRGVVDSEGAFVVGTRTTADGATEGDYVVTIVWPAEQDESKHFDNTPPDRLKNRYNDLKHPQWNVHVAAGLNTLEDFALD